MKKTIHITVADALSVLPFVFPTENAFLLRRAACHGRLLEHGMLDTFDGLASPTCPKCLALWKAVLIERDRRLEAA